MDKKAAAALGGMLAVVLLMGYGQVSVPAQPGDINDPVVTKRYVDEQIDIVKALMGQGGLSSGTSGLSQLDRDALFADVLAYFETVYGQPQEAYPAQGAAQVPYEAVFAPAGRTLIGRSGTEMILRGGAAAAVSGVNGLCDVTVGADVLNGTDIALNHLLIVPGDDGRGMRFLTDSYLMIKGEYYFVD